MTLRTAERCASSLSILLMPEAYQEISRGLSERERAQPAVVKTKNSRTLETVRGVLHTPSGPGFLSCSTVFPGVRKKRVPLANFRAPLRGAFVRLREVQNGETLRRTAERCTARASIRLSRRRSADRR